MVKWSEEDLKKWGVCGRAVLAETPALGRMLRFIAGCRAALRKVNIPNETSAGTLVNMLFEQCVEAVMIMFDVPEEDPACGFFALAFLEAGEITLEQAVGMLTVRRGENDRLAGRGSVSAKKKRGHP
jgi:hypothetical protein